MVSCCIYTVVSTSFQFFVLKSALDFILLLYSHTFLARRAVILPESIFGQVYGQR